MKNELSENQQVELQKALLLADKYNPGAFRVFRGKNPLLYVQCAVKILQERLAEAKLNH